jgi:hypothetical protein
MSPDSDQPGHDWWQRRPEPPGDEPEEQGYQASAGSQDSQATRQYPANRNYQDPQATQRAPAGPAYQQDSEATRQYPLERGRPAGQGYQPGQGQGQPGQRYQADQGYAGGQGFAAGQGYQPGPGFPPAPSFQPSEAGFQPDQDYPAAHAYQDSRGRPGGSPASPDYPPSQGFPAAPGYQAAPATRARRRRRWPWITLIVIIVLLVAADRGANAFAEDQMASQFQSSLELSGKPHVTIQGFPFLTQLAAQDFHQVNINASNETAGPGGQLEISSLTATLHGMHIHGTNSATIDDFTASALVTFSALAHAGNLPGGITLSAAGPNQIRAHIDLAVFSGDATLQVTQVGASKINIKLVNANGLPADLLGNLVNFTVSIPKLPAGVKIQRISITSQGLRLTATGHNTTLSQ